MCGFGPACDPRDQLFELALLTPGAGLAARFNNAGLETQWRGILELHSICRYG